MDGLPALGLWDVVIEVVHSFEEYRVNNPRSKRKLVAKFQLQTQKKREPRCWWSVWFGSRCHKRKFFSRRISVVQFWRHWSGDQHDHQREEAPTMRHVSRTHRVALDWVFDRINLDTDIQISCVETKNQLADIFDQRKFHAWGMESSSSFIQHHEVPDVFLQPFSFEQKAEHRCWRELRKGRPKKDLRKRNQDQHVWYQETSLGAKQTSSFDSGASYGGRNQELGRNSVFGSTWKPCAGQGPEPSNEFSRVAKRWPSVSRHRETCAEWCVWALK